jgi:hypothetical protein
MLEYLILLLIVIAIIGILGIVGVFWIIKKLFFPKKKPKTIPSKKISSSAKSVDVYHHHDVTKNVYHHHINDDYDYDYDYYRDKPSKRGDDNDDLIDKAVAFGTGALTGYGLGKYGEEIEEKVEELTEEVEDIIDDITDEAEDFVDDMDDDFDDGDDY